MKLFPRPGTRTRCLLGLLAGLAVVGAGLNPAAAQDDATPRLDSVRTADGHAIQYTYYPAIGSQNPAGLQNAPVVVLLHGDDQGRVLWDNGSVLRGTNITFPVMLQNNGYAVFTVDLRKHGESRLGGEQVNIRPQDWEAMAAIDLVAIKQKIFEEHQAQQLNMNKLAIVAVGPTAPVAAAFAVNDWQLPPYDDAPVVQNKTPRGQDVRALVMVSPDSGAGRLSTARTITFLRGPQLGVAMLVLVGAQDPQDKGQATKVYDLMAAGQRRNDPQRVYMLTPNLKDRGLGLFGKLTDQVEEPTLNFLNRHVKEYDSPWRDRRNKVTGR
ncbi:MAG: hypothetical protein KF774_16210 [Planctomyces sp.]|nr:hypothetical protein [Planctomyces sp.]